MQQRRQHHLGRALRTPLARWLYHQRREITAALVLLGGGGVHIHRPACHAAPLIGSEEGVRSMETTTRTGTTRTRGRRSHRRGWRRRIARSPIGRWASHRRFQLAAVLSLLVVSAIIYLLILSALPPGVR